MSTDAGTKRDDSQRPTHITLELAEDGEVWVVRDEDTGVATQGETREEALANLDDAVALHKGKSGEPVTEADLRELGVDPESVPDEPGVPDAPWFHSDEE